MDIFFNESALLDLAKSFYLATGLRITIWSYNHIKSVAYPKMGCDFCEMIKSKPYSEQQCWKCDSFAMKKVNKNENCIIYNCHTGLIDCILQIWEGDIVVGYLMLGQVSDNPDKEMRKKQLLDITRSYNLPDEKAIPAIDKICYYSREKLTAAAKLAEICASYIMAKKLILPEDNQIVSRTIEYIQNNIEKNILVNDICNELNISRSTLYNTFKNENITSVGKHILELKMDYARTLLINTNTPVKDVAEKVGFSDYNYFSRIYKKTYGMSPYSYRKI